MKTHLWFLIQTCYAYVYVLKHPYLQNFSPFFPITTTPILNTKMMISQRDYDDDNDEGLWGARWPSGIGHRSSSKISGFVFMENGSSASLQDEASWTVSPNSIPSMLRRWAPTVSIPSYSRGSSLRKRFDDGVHARKRAHARTRTRAHGNDHACTRACTE